MRQGLCLLDDFFEGASGSFVCAFAVHQTIEVMIGQQDGPEFIGELIQIQVRNKVTFFDTDLCGACDNSENIAQMAS